MTNDEQKGEADAGADTEMPMPPDLSSLFQKQTQQINDACQKANQACVRSANRKKAQTELTI